MLSKKEIMLNPPNEVHLSLDVPSNIVTDEQLHKYLWDNFHIDLDTDSESDNYYDLFYNQDLRSMMGFMRDWCNFVIFPTYYIERDEPSSNWSKMWRQLVRQSEVINLD